MKHNNILNIFNTFIWPSVKAVIESSGLKVYTTSVNTGSSINDSELTINVTFLRGFDSITRNNRLLKQKLQGKLWNLFSEYGIIVNVITCNYDCFPDLIIEISIKELTEHFRQVNENKILA